MQAFLVLAALAAGALPAGVRAARAADPPPAALQRLTRNDLIAQDPARFAAVYDSLLFRLLPDHPELAGGLLTGAQTYLEATGDSILLADHVFFVAATPQARRDWYAAVRDEARGGELQRRGEVAAAIPLLERAAETYRRIGPLRREAVAWGSLGVAYWVAGNFDGVGKAYGNALAAREKLGDPVLLGRTLNGLGSLNTQLGDYPKALDYYRRALAVREKLGNPTDLGTTLAYIGNVEYRLGNLEDAREHYRRALDVFGPDASDRVRYPALLGLANVNGDLGEHAEAVDLYRQIADAAEARGDTLQAALTRRNMAKELALLGRLADALRELTSVREVQESAGDRRELSATLNTIASIHADLGDYQRALAEYSLADTLSAGSGNDPSRCQSLWSLGYVLSQMGLHDRAMQYYQKARDIAEGLQDPLLLRGVLESQAITDRDRKDYAGAAELIRKALDIDTEAGRLVHVAGDRVNLANNLGDLGRLDEAMKEYRQGVALAESLGRTETQGFGYLGIADLFESKGLLDSARVYNDKAIERMESLSADALTSDVRSDFLGRTAYVYEAQVHVLAKLDAERPGRGYAEDAFVTAERGKARAFLDALAEGSVDLDAGAPPALRDERHRLERSLNQARYRLRSAQNAGAPADSIRALEKGVRALVDRDSALLERMRLENPRYSAAAGGRPLGLAAVRKELLGKNEALLEFSLGDSASYLWVVTRKGFTLHRLPPRDAVTEAVRKLRSGLASPAASGDVELLSAAAGLYDDLLRGAEPDLRGAETVTIVPDGALQFLPFEVLLTRHVDPPSPDLDAAARNRFFAGLPYAFSGRRVRYGPSATVLAGLAKERREDEKRSHPMDLLAVGDPVFSSGSGAEAEAAATRTGLAPLPYTRDEVERISGYFKPSRRTLLLGKEASERRLAEPDLLTRYRILHIATHGLVDERRPEQSALALSFPTSPDEDGYLRASEIYRLPVTADLVVLSACETGLGRMVRGEGVLGLPRAFFYAGATSVMVSLWSVSDRSTADLMDAFYRGLEREGDPPSEALARAQKALRGSAGFAHPFYWAPFVLLGPA